MSIIYGVDTSRPFRPEDARDAIVECFTQAHKKILENELAAEIKNMSVEEFERIKYLNIQQLIRSYFEEIGGNYDAPDKESLVAVCDKLAEFAKRFRAEDMIEKHYSQIMQLVDKL